MPSKFKIMMQNTKTRMAKPMKEEMPKKKEMPKEMPMDKAKKEMKVKAKY